MIRLFTILVLSLLLTTTSYAQQIAAITDFPYWGAVLGSFVGVGFGLKYGSLDGD